VLILRIPNRTLKAEPIKSDVKLGSRHSDLICSTGAKEKFSLCHLAFPAPRAA